MGVLHLLRSYAKWFHTYMYVKIVGACGSVTVSVYLQHCDLRAKFRVQELGTSVTPPLLAGINAAAFATRTQRQQPLSVSVSIVFSAMLVTDRKLRLACWFNGKLDNSSTASSSIRFHSNCSFPFVVSFVPTLLKRSEKHSM